MHSSNSFILYFIKSLVSSSCLCMGVGPFFFFFFLTTFFLFVDAFVNLGGLKKSLIKSFMSLCGILNVLNLTGLEDSDYISYNL